jgi:hypothetical protein
MKIDGMRFSGLSGGRDGKATESPDSATTTSNTNATNTTQTTNMTSEENDGFKVIDYDKISTMSISGDCKFGIRAVTEVKSTL